MDECITKIFEDNSRLQLLNPAFGRDIINSSFQLLQETSLIPPSLVPWMIHIDHFTQYSRSQSQSFIPRHDYYFFQMPIEPIFFFLDPCWLSFVRPEGITLHHQLVFQSRISADEPNNHPSYRFYKISSVSLTLSLFPSTYIFKHHPLFFFFI